MTRINVPNFPLNALQFSGILMSDSSLFSLAESHFGIITASELSSATTKWRRQRLLDEGILTREDHNVYVVVGSQREWYQRAFVALRSVPECVLSHRSAAHHWGILMEHNDSDPIDVVTETDFHVQRSTVKAHKTTQLEDHTTEYEGLRITTVERTIIDLAAVAEPHVLSAAITLAVSKHLTTVELIEKTLGTMRTKGRRGSKRLKSMLQRKDPTRLAAESGAERRVYDAIRDSSFPDPTPQCCVDTPYGQYRIDFAYPERRIGIEVDGPHHLSRTQSNYDRRRDQHLSAQGWLMVHIGFDMQPTEYLPLIGEALAARPPSLHQV